MKIIFITAAVVLSKLYTPYQEDGFQPVCKLPRAGLLSNAYRFTTGKRLAKDSTTFHMVPYKRMVPTMKLTGMYDRMDDIFTTKNRPIQFSMLVSGNHVNRLRLTYSGNFF
jgi:hypothetical protein